MKIARAQLGRLLAPFSTLSFVLCVALPAGAANLPRLPSDGLLLSINVAGHTVLAVGAAGAIQRSADDGQTWQLRGSFTKATLTRVARAAETSPL